MNKGDNEPIGIVLGAEKNHILVKYALGGISNKLFASKYRLSLPDKELFEKEMKQIISKDKKTPTWAIRGHGDPYLKI